MEPTIYKPSIYNGAGIYNNGGGNSDIYVESGLFTPIPIYRINNAGTDYVVRNYIQDYYNTNSLCEIEFLKDNDLFIAQGTNSLKLFGTNNFNGTASEPLNIAILAYSKNSDYDSIYNKFRVMNYSSGNVEIQYNMADFLNATKIKFIIDSDKVYVYFDDVLYSSATITTWSAINANTKIFYTFGASASYQSLSPQIALVKAKITNKNTNKVQFDFISCRREMDQKLGVWDNIAAQFYSVTDQSSVNTIS